MSVMGVVNVTPDSFSDGGRFVDASGALFVDRALAHARELVAVGAAILDVGGESTRPGAEPVSVAEELRRVIPVVEALAADATVPVSSMRLFIGVAWMAASGIARRSISSTEPVLVPTRTLAA